MVVSGSKDSIVMVEGGALELTEAEIVKGLEVAHKGIRELLDAANELVADMRQPKMEWTKVEPPAELVARVKQLAEARGSEALNLPEKSERAPPRGTGGKKRPTASTEGTKEPTTSFLLHNTSPPFSTGEVKPIRGTSRREVGHGALAERALQALLPPYDQFPYTLRIVSDILESNGSSSMATVCGGSLALFDAGVPMTAACAGVAMGLIKEGRRVAVLTDILGTEDHLGDMDFKVAGTRQGVSSIQMDIKIEGLDFGIVSQALEKAKQARLHILDIMDQAMPKPRSELSKYAPRIITIEILPGVEGLLHISELQHGRTERTEDVVKKGDHVRVKLLEVDERGRMRLSRKALMDKPEAAPARSH